MARQQSRTVFFTLAAIAATFLSTSIALADEAEVEFNIESQELGAALSEFALQSGKEILFVEADVKGKSAPSVSGQYVSTDALKLLLADTNLNYRVSALDTVLVGAVAENEGGDSDSGNARRAPILMAKNQAAVNAQDVSERAGAANGQKTAHEVPEITVFGRGVESTLQEVPQSTVLFDRNFLEDIAAVELRDVVRFIPTASTDRPHNGTVTQQIKSRGFEATYVTNGQSPLNTSPPRDPAGLERIEVLQGPASVLYGAMEPGAVVNLITKKPLDTPHFAFGLEFGSYNAHRYTMDTGRPLGDRVRVRLNAAYDSRETFYDYWERERIYLAPAVELDLTDRTLLTLEMSYRRFEDANGINDGRYPMAGTVLPNPNGQIPKDFSPVQPGFGDWEQSVRQYSASLSHDLNDNWALNAYVDRERVAAGGIQWFPTSFQADMRTLNRLLFHFDLPEHSTFATVSIGGEIGTGPLTHNLIAGADYLDQESKTIFGLTALSGIDVFNPVRGENIIVPAPNSQSVGATTASGVFLQDRITIGQRFTVLAGLRWSEIESLSAFAGYPGPLPELTGTRQDDISTQFGLVYDAADSVALYASRTTSFTPRGGTSFGGEPFDPETGLQYEVGAKALVFGAMSGSIALFRIEKPDVLITDPNNVGFLVPLGEVQSKGVELALSGRPMDELFVHATYARLDTESETGFALPTAPENTAGLLVRYDFPAALGGFSLSGSLQYRDRMFPGTNGGVAVPSYTRVDLGIDYALNEHTELSVNVRNAFDAEVWNAVQTATAARGEDRTITAGIHYRL